MYKTYEIIRGYSGKIYAFREVYYNSYSDFRYCIGKTEMMGYDPINEQEYHNSAWITTQDEPLGIKEGGYRHEYIWTDRKA